ncbi:hypothetical protein DFJ73DRAFT_95545 [Zopfochytrium polystomum]|nr:hypothetical protein DFJ73DRAFT_95545 [Zopfochytrium polystomum]
MGVIILESTVAKLQQDHLELRHWLSAGSLALGSTGGREGMVFIDSLIFGAAVSMAVAAAEAAVAKLLSLFYLRAGQPGTAVAIRLGFSGRSPSTSLIPPARVIGPLLLAALAYVFLSAVRVVDTQITSAVPRVTTWTTSGMTLNRTIDLELVTRLSSNMTITPQMAAAMYPGLAPPFDGGGYEWFAMVSKQQPVDLKPLEPLTFATPSQYAKETTVRDMSNTIAKKRDEVIVVGYGNEETGGGLSRKNTRHVWIPRDASTGTRTYAVLNFAAVSSNTQAYNVSTVISRTTFNLQPQPDNATDVSDSLCLWKAQGNMYSRLVAIVTPSASDVRVISAYDYVDPAIALLFSSFCGSAGSVANVTTLGDAMTFMKCLKGLSCNIKTTPITFSAKTSEYFVNDPLLISGATAGDILVDMDKLLLGPGPGDVDYIEYNGKLVKIELSLIIALASVAAASLLVIIWPCLRSENLAFGGMGDPTEPSETHRGWSWDLLAHQHLRKNGHKYQEPAESGSVGDSVPYIVASKTEGRKNHGTFSNY